MKVPTPQQLGLPEKFDSWRPTQEACLERLMTATQRVKAGQMPTGSGKSPVLVGYAIHTNEPTCIVTRDNGLLKQYMDDFGSIGLVSIMGRGQYQCALKDEWSCEEGHTARCPYEGSIQCPSSQAEMRCATSRLVVTNYSKWIAAKRFGTGMAHFTQVFFDEGHFAPDALASAMQQELNHKEIELTLEVPFPKYPDFNDIKVWKSWAITTQEIARAEMRKAAQEIKDKGYDKVKAKVVKHHNHMRNLVRRLGIIATCNPVNWIVEHKQEQDLFAFDPIRPGRYGESMLLMNTPNVVIFSATLNIKTLKLIGVGGTNRRDIPGGEVTDNYIYSEYDSDFNPEDCPIYYIPTQCVDAKHQDLSMLWMRLDQWLAKRTDRKGIIHTVSHARREDIMANSRFASKMIFNPKGEPAAKIVKDFKDAGPGTNLVTPSVSMGYDFPGDQCEHNFMIKIPFEPPSKILKAREADDPQYRGYRAIQTMDQAFGRGNRFPGDPCENAIPDDNMKWFWPQYWFLASKWFRKRLRFTPVVPPPLPKYKG